MPVAKPAAKPEPTPAANDSGTAPLPPAGEATNPEVHRLLAELETARLNGNGEGARGLAELINGLGYAV